MFKVVHCMFEFEHLKYDICLVQENPYILITYNQPFGIDIYRCTDPNYSVYYSLFITYRADSPYLKPDLR